MQDKSIEFLLLPYHDGMKSGRPKKSDKTDFAKRLTHLRKEAGYSQREMASLLGISQPSYVLWEQRDVSLRPEQVLSLSKILKVNIQELYGIRKKRNIYGGPSGKTRQTFEKVSQLSQHQQKKILEVVDALLLRQKTTS